MVGVGCTGRRPGRGRRWQPWLVCKQLRSVGKCLDGRRLGAEPLPKIALGSWQESETGSSCERGSPGLSSPALGTDGASFSFFYPSQRGADSLPAAGPALSRQPARAPHRAAASWLLSGEAGGGGPRPLSPLSCGRSGPGDSGPSISGDRGPASGHWTCASKRLPLPAAPPPADGPPGSRERGRRPPGGSDVCTHRGARTSPSGP